MKMVIFMNIYKFSYRNHLKKKIEAVEAMTDAI